MFRENVAALIRYKNRYLGCFRSDHRTWQNVQGGIEKTDKNPMDAIIRETKEELGVTEKDFKIIYQSIYWRRYFFPKEILKKNRFKGNIGQEQLWFLIELQDFNAIKLEKSAGEFSKVDLFAIQDLINFYSSWKKSSFYDFCRELDLLSFKN
ncbi:NUDIX domain-containing protein [Spirobacillus cienkowskii]|jgi:putative (di)nucleoside polyphosphate hydrolase|uniref:NUDIX domain-containing protein n=1 Tax=Spirobacillus cienkowskii TaxID=495820 RepID=A0A369KSU1_9BACT|nr:MAG: NUDIX domain-containing protein [Spirobacillus cienkowskii]